MGSGGVASATRGMGAWTLAPFPGELICKGKPQSAAGGGSAAAGTIVRFEGAVGVIGQFATFLGSPPHPANTARMSASTTLIPIGMPCCPGEWPNIRCISIFDLYSFRPEQYLIASAECGDLQISACRSDR